MSEYGPEFFRKLHESSRTSAEVVAPLVCELLAPASIVDVGCGGGEWLDAFSRHGVSDYLGIDGAYGDHATLPEAHFVAKDLAVSCSLDRTFDLAMSLEVAEHLPVERAGSFVADLVKLAPAVLFSAAIPGQGGFRHINEQWQSWWADLFALQGYSRQDLVRPLIWNDDRVAYWYRQNTILYVRDAEPTKTILDVVHPRTLTGVFEPEGSPSIRQSAAEFLGAARRSIRHRFGSLQD